MGVFGLSVTIPHKQTVIELAGSVDESVKAAGACNTLVLDEESQRWAGYNTDWKGFLKPIADLSLEGRSALVIGAGGAARAVVYALITRGMNITIVNRTLSRAEKLAREFGCACASIEEAGRLFNKNPEGPLLVVQTTSAGMNPDAEADPAPGLQFTGREIVYDIIYTPEETVFLKRATEAGCRTINGSTMLKAQAAEQFLLFTGINP
jgi:shikimate dehydrogenase